MTPQPYEPTFFLLKRRIPASDSTNLLGRVIRQYQDPTLDYTPESPSESLTAAAFEKYLLGAQHDDTAHFRAGASLDGTLWARMGALLSFSSTSAQGGTTDVISPRITTRRLKREAEYFKALKAIPLLRRQILDMCPVGGDAVYLIVGTMSIQTATFSSSGTRQRNLAASSEMPVGVAASATAASAGIPLTSDAVPNPEMGVQRSNTSDWTMEFSATAMGDDGEAREDAEEVFAIACKAIRRDWQGFGSDVKLKGKRPEYRGGQHFGTNDESDNNNEDSDNDSEAETLAAENLNLTEVGAQVFPKESVVLNPVAGSAFS
ncbi:MAG: hypothetical protein Q9168_008334 [Polycauliona sp. 1 TL-2023]